MVDLLSKKVLLFGLLIAAGMLANTMYLQDVGVVDAPAAPAAPAGGDAIDAGGDKGGGDAGGDLGGGDAGGEEGGEDVIVGGDAGGEEGGGDPVVVGGDKGDGGSEQQGYESQDDYEGNDEGTKGGYSLTYSAKIPEAVGACTANIPCGTNIGACRGYYTCEGGVFKECSAPKRGEIKEICGNDIDDDCDGSTDEGCQCIPGTYPCNADVYTLLVSNIYSAAAAPGNIIATTSGGITPGITTSFPNLTTATSGITTTIPNLTATITTAPLSAVNVTSLCRTGYQTCSWDEEDEVYKMSRCRASYRPRREICGNAFDEDCDGQLDNGCECQLGDIKKCGTSDFGVCEFGVMHCNAGYWGGCTGSIGPTPEVCNDSLDNDCDGVIDDGCPDRCDNIDNDNDNRIDEDCYSCYIKEKPKLKPVTITPPLDTITDPVISGSGDVTATGGISTGIVSAITVLPVNQCCYDIINKDKTVKTKCFPVNNDLRGNTFLFYTTDLKVYTLANLINPIYQVSSSVCRETCDGLDNDCDGIIDEGCEQPLDLIVEPEKMSIDMLKTDTVNKIILVRNPNAREINVEAFVDPIKFAAGGKLTLTELKASIPSQKHVNFYLEFEAIKVTAGTYNTQFTVSTDNQEIFVTVPIVIEVCKNAEDCEEKEDDELIPLEPPQNLVANSTSYGAETLWQPPELLEGQEVDSYLVYRSLLADMEEHVLIGSSETTYLADDSCELLTENYYTVTALDAEGTESSFSNIDSAICATTCSDGGIPEDEICGNGIDDDCDGSIDEDCGGCAEGDTIPCGSDEGTCSSGLQYCTAGSWGECTGSIGSTPEVCEDALDNDCDGSVDEGCEECTEGSTVTCGNDLGVCSSGTQVCAGGAWGECTGVIFGTTEICRDSVDNDCDGLTDEGCGFESLQEKSAITLPGGGSSANVDISGGISVSVGSKTVNIGDTQTIEVTSSANNLSVPGASVIVTSPTGERNILGLTSREGAVDFRVEESGTYNVEAYRGTMTAVASFQSLAFLSSIVGVVDTTGEWIFGNSYSEAPALFMLLLSVAIIAGIFAFFVSANFLPDAVKSTSRARSEKIIQIIMGVAFFLAPVLAGRYAGPGAALMLAIVEIALLFLLEYQKNGVERIRNFKSFFVKAPELKLIK